MHSPINYASVSERQSKAAKSIRDYPIRDYPINYVSVSERQSKAAKSISHYPRETHKSPW